MKRLFAKAARRAAACWLLLIASLPALAATAGAADAADVPSTQPFTVQVIGVQWLNPLQRWDYPTQWQLLWTLGMARPNPDDERVKDSPGQFSSLQYVRPVAGETQEGESFSARHEKTLAQLLRGLSSRYFSDPQYFYSVAHQDRRRWRELGNIHVEYALPKERMEADEAREAVRRQIVQAFSVKPQKAAAKFAPSVPTPDVQMTMGDCSAGLISLYQAIEYLRANPRATAWVMGWDAPEFPAQESIAQNMVLLVLAGPQANTGRQALAHIGLPASYGLQYSYIYYPSKKMGEIWQKSIEMAAGHAGINPSDMGYLIHDAGSRLPDDHIWSRPNPEERLQGLALSMQTLLPTLDYRRQALDTPTVLGHMGAGTGLTNVALAIAHAHHSGKAVLVAGTTFVERPKALFVMPPAAAAQPATGVQPSQPWYRAPDGPNQRLPWWGPRHDAPAYPPGYSE